MKKSDPKTLRKKIEKEPEPEIDDSGPHIFDVLKENAQKNHVDETKREKSLKLNYTIAILKPNLISVSKNCRIIIDKIEKENFEIFDIILKYLTYEEISNLYYKHTTKEYFHQITEYMSSGPVAILVLINKCDHYLDSNGIKNLYSSPFTRWKDLIGHKDPSQAKIENPLSLRGIYGVDIIKNEFWGSDSNSDAYRELSIFMIRLPTRPPVFSYDINKINAETIMKFLFPIKPNHPDVSGRLDIFSKYGPVVNHHLLDICVCKKCRHNIKQLLIESENKTLKSSRDKIINEDIFTKFKQHFCSECHQHFNLWTHLFTGFEQTHIMTNQEIDFLVSEMNKQDLLTVLKYEKGSSADTILSSVNINSPPEEVQYTRKHIEKLLQNVTNDYYDRYDFSELQNLINEDRRIRINFWVYKIIGKPPISFKNPMLINTDNYTAEDIKNINNLKSKNFTLLRSLPIVVKNEEEKLLKDLLIENPLFLKSKLTDHEINQKKEKLLSKNFCKVSNLDSKVDKNVVSNMLLLRNYELERIKENKFQKKLKK